MIASQRLCGYNPAVPIILPLCRKRPWALLRRVVDCAIATPALLCLNLVAQPGHVYFVVGSDTAIWNAGTTVDVYTRHPHYSQDSFTVPGSPSFVVMNPTWRSQYRDSFGQSIKFTWWMMGGNIFSDADNVNVPLNSTMTLYLMQKYHGDAIRQFGDEVSLHYHTYFWSDYTGGGTFYWNQSRTFNESRPDFEVTLAQYLLEQGVFPVSFRSGWHFMDQDWQQYLNEILPYCLHDDYGVYKGWYTNEPIFGVEDWSNAPSAFVPFHPSTNDYQVPGQSPGWNVRSIKMQNLVQSQANQIFSQASNGVDQVACIWEHLPENFVTNFARVASLIEHAAANYPTVSFRYCTAVEAMQLWQGITNDTPPQLQVTASTNNASQTVTLTISTDKNIFQPLPFVALRDAFRNYSNLTSLCAPTGSNTWTITLPVPLGTIAKVGVAVTDPAGNLATSIIRYLPDDLYLDNLDPQYSEIQGNWTSTTNAAWGVDARVALLNSNETAQARWSLPISASGLYNLAFQVPSLTNAATHLLFQLLADQSNVCSISITSSLPRNQWKFLCSAYLDQSVSNSLVLTVAGTNQPKRVALADVISVVPVVVVPGLPAQNQLAIASIWNARLIQFSGEPGTPCSILRSTNLSSGWTTLDSVTVPLTGLLEFQDRNPPAVDAFYRVAQP